MELLATSFSKNCFLFGGGGSKVVELSLKCLESHRISDVVPCHTAVFIKVFPEVPIGRISSAKFVGPFGCLCFDVRLLMQLFVAGIPVSAVFLS